MIVPIFQGTGCFHLSCSIYERMIIYSVSLLFFKVCADVPFSFQILVISVISWSIWQEMQSLSAAGASIGSSLSLLLFSFQI